MTHIRADLGQSSTLKTLGYLALGGKVETWPDNLGRASSV
jgi:hypothetical protein